MEDQNTAWTSIVMYYKGVQVKKSIPANKSADAIIDTIDEYLEKGFKPSWNEETNNTALGVKTTAQTPLATPQAPVCGVHGTQMTWKTGQYKTTTAYHKVGDPYAFWSCPTKNADGSYCDFKPKN